MRLEYQPEAIADLKEIAKYIAQDNLVAAAKMVDGVEAVCQGLIDNPLMGRSRNELEQGLRSFPYRAYIVFYKVQLEAVTIVRVIHSAMDVESIFHPN